MENQKRLQNEIEQDRIAKTLEPVVAEYNLRKLPQVLEDQIRWWAREPTPTAKIMKNVRVSWRVFPHYERSIWGPGKKCLISAEVCQTMDTFRRPYRGPGRCCQMVFRIRDIPLDAEPTDDFEFH